MTAAPTELRSARLLLRRWRSDDLAPFAELNADPVVMEFYPSTLTRDASDGSGWRRSSRSRRRSTSGRDA